jgi:hypothetical protein
LNRGSKLALGVLVALIVLFAAAKLHYAGRPPIVLPAADCNAELWNHVYERDRLRVIAECTAVEGRVVYVRHAEDGDLHIALDPDQKSVLNLINVIHAHRTLVVESICEHLPENAAAQAACSNFHRAVTVPAAGDHVRVTGAYVIDTDNGWAEIHPVSMIDVPR